MPKAHDIDDRERTEAGPTRTAQTSGWSPWVSTGLIVSAVTLCGLGILVALLASLAVNAYLAWQLTGLEISVGRRQATPVAVVVVTPTPVPTVAPTSTPLPPPTASPVPLPTATATAPPTRTPAPPPTSTPSPTPTDTPVPVISSNEYKLIPLIDERDDIPPDEHPDLNLKLRELQEVEAELSLVEIGGLADPNAPQLSKVFEPDFLAAYAVHEWDWDCNCLGELEPAPSVVAIKTTPGELLYIPPSKQDIFEDTYYAVVLYASPDSLTFMYAREGTVFPGYAIHYVGLRTDPNLLALYRKSPADQLPGLTLDSPVGIATDRLIVATRDGGKFLDARSRKDWWQ